MKALSFLLLQAPLITKTLAFGDATCYRPNGTATPPGGQIRQCTTGVSTICCALDRTKPAGSEVQDGELVIEDCLSNGLCQERFTANGTAQTVWWLEHCTDSDVTSENCLDVCSEYRDEGGFARMTPCDIPSDGSYDARADERDARKWCCGSSNECCTTGVDAVVLPKNFTGRTVQTSTSSSSISSPTGSPTSSSPPVLGSSRNGLSTGVKAGIGVGAGVGVIAVGLALFFGRKVYGYRRLHKQSSMMMPLASHPEPMYPTATKYPMPGYQDYEFTASSGPAELPPNYTAGGKAASSSPVELPVLHDYRNQ